MVYFMIYTVRHLSDFQRFQRSTKRVGQFDPWGLSAHGTGLYTFISMTIIFTQLDDRLADQSQISHGAYLGKNVLVVMFKTLKTFRTRSLMTLKLLMNHQ